MTFLLRTIVKSFKLFVKYKLCFRQNTEYIPIFSLYFYSYTDGYHLNFERQCQEIVSLHFRPHTILSQTKRS